MTSLERRALLGDRQSQEECTRRGIVLPCPCCLSQDISYCTSEGDYDYGLGGFRCWDCDLGQCYEFATEEKALENWNTRPAPPIGRCVECAYSGNWTDNQAICDLNNGDIVEPDFFCSYFEPKERKENERA